MVRGGGWKEGREKEEGGGWMVGEGRRGGREERERSRRKGNGWLSPIALHYEICVRRRRLKEVVVQVR